MFEGVGLFVFSDPGAAKGVLALAVKLKPALKDLLVLSDREYVFYNHFDVEVVKPALIPVQIITDLKPDFVLTGTSYTSKIELEYLKAAKRLGILSYSFVDHWTSMIERFRYNSEHVFPDKILVIDDMAWNNAILSGIDKDLLYVFGNPYYDFLRSWKPHFTKRQLLESLNVFDTERKLVVFTPDPLSNVHGKEVYGFDEIEATAAIATILESLDTNCNFVLKLHPNQKVDHIIKVAGDEMIIAKADIDTTLLLYHADLVIGFFSNALIEASLLGKKVLRVYVNSLQNDPLDGKGVGEIATVGRLSQYLTEL